MEPLGKTWLHPHKVLLPLLCVGGCASRMWRCSSKQLLLYDVRIQSADAKGRAEVWYEQVASTMIPHLESSCLSSRDELTSIAYAC